MEILSNSIFIFIFYRTIFHDKPTFIHIITCLKLLAILSNWTIARYYFVYIFKNFTRKKGTKFFYEKNLSVKIINIINVCLSIKKSKMGDETPKKSNFDRSITVPSSLPKPTFLPEPKSFSTKKVRLPNKMSFYRLQCVCEMWISRLNRIGLVC